MFATFSPFLSRKIFILKCINFHAEPFQRKFVLIFANFGPFCANARNLVCAKISTIKVATKMHAAERS